MPSPQIFPALLIERNNRSSVICADAVQASTVLFTHTGIGTVRIWPPFPIKSRSPNVLRAVESTSSSARAIHPAEGHTQSASRASLCCACCGECWRRCSPAAACLAQRLANFRFVSRADELPSHGVCQPPILDSADRNQLPRRQLGELLRDAG